MENVYISYIALDRFVEWVYICITIFFSSVIIYFVFLCSGYIADYMSSSLWLDLLVFMFKGYNISSEGEKVIKIHILMGYWVTFCICTQCAMVKPG